MLSLKKCIPIIIILRAKRAKTIGHISNALVINKCIKEMYFYNLNPASEASEKNEGKFQMLSSLKRPKNLWPPYFKVLIFMTPLFFMSQNNDPQYIWDPLTEENDSPLIVFIYFYLLFDLISYFILPVLLNYFTCDCIFIYFTSVIFYFTG